MPNNIYLKIYYKSDCFFCSCRWETMIPPDKPRSTHQMCSIEKGVLINFAKFTGKHLCQSLFLNKVEDLFRTPPDDCFQS